MIPKFCPIHTKIHVCEEQSIKSQNQRIDKEIDSKVRRLHGTPNQEDIEKAAKHSKPQKGTLQWILENAKKHNQKIKAQTKDYEDDDGNIKKVDDKELNSRVAALKMRLSSNGGKVVNQPQEKIDVSKIDKTKLTLQQILMIAKQNNPTSKKEYKPPKRSDIAPKVDILKSRGKKTIYQANSLKILEDEIENAKKSTLSNKQKNAKVALKQPREKKDRLSSTNDLKYASDAPKTNKSVSSKPKTKADSSSLKKSPESIKSTSKSPTKNKIKK
ncbi:hypothetical protein [Spiroplasma endosymbiont of Aspidapion aeneum]|uniref:hypothetical protein n=1 Tax=Spiroplasma endosymbiont of Aspidapion aeneum TaxID=3066276 RepID=UPI00313F3BED